MAAMTFADAATMIGVAAALVTAAGVFVGPNLAERARRKETARAAHLERIRTRCLEPVEAGAEAVVDKLRPSEASGTIINDANEKMPTFTATLFATPVPAPSPPRTPRILFPESDSVLFDEVLYRDLGNHFPELKSRIDEAENLVATRAVRAMELQWELSMRVFTLTRQEVGAIRAGGISAMGVAICGTVLSLTGVEPAMWPNIHNAAIANGIMPIIDGLREDAESMKLAAELKREREAVVAGLTRLLDELRTEAESERRLPGKCGLLP